MVAPHPTRIASPESRADRLELTHCGEPNYLIWGRLVRARADAVPADARGAVRVRLTARAVASEMFKTVAPAPSRIAVRGDADPEEAQMSARLDMVGLVVVDMERSLAFYRELGFEFAADAAQKPHV